jgi:hypothetical protein
MHIYTHLQVQALDVDSLPRGSSDLGFVQVNDGELKREAVNGHLALASFGL